MQQAGVVEEFLPKSIYYGRTGNKTIRPCKSGGRRIKSSSSASGRDSVAFLSQNIEPIRTSDEQYLLTFGIDVKESFSRLERNSRKFLDFYGYEYNVDYSGCKTSSDKIVRLTEWLSGQVLSAGYELSLSRDYEGKYLSFVIYYPLEELDYTICIFYCAPAQFLSPEGGRIYKDFIKFISDSMGIDIGAVENNSNYYLDAIVNWIDEGNEEFSDESDEDELLISKQYRNGGSFYKLFEEISSQKRLSSNEIMDELKAYLPVCKKDEVELIECMIEGVPLISKMYVGWYDFVPDSYDEEYDDERMAIPWTTSILYSSKDGMGDELLECLNSNMQSGIEASRWLNNLPLTGKTKADDIREFEADRNLGKRFGDWMDKFNKLAEKFDNYGKDKGYSEQ